MFNKDFYPTSKKAFRELLEIFPKGKFSILKTNSLILEPSAGKGDIADLLCEDDNFEVNGRFYSHKNQTNEKIHCIEKEPELQSILREKKYFLVGDDFLTFQTDTLYDYIIMNPPFSNGADHLLKAIEIMHDGEIGCILNAETLKNPYTEKRKLLKQKLKNLNATIKFKDGLFVDSERKTNVEVALIYINKKDDSVGNIFDDFEKIDNEKSFNLDDDTVQNELVLNDSISALLSKYDDAKKLFVEYVKIKNKLDDRLNQIYSKPIDENNDIVDYSFNQKKPKEKLNVFNNMLNKGAWKSIFKNSKLSNLMTKNVKKEFEKFQKEQGQMPFTEKNIHSLIDTLFMSRNDIFNQSIQEVFDELTKFDDKNKVYIEGWKSNDNWVVNKKCIIPYAVEQNYSGNGYKLYYGYGWSRGEFFRDFENVLGRLSGIKDYTTVQETLDKSKPEGKMDNIYYTSFFELRCFKKGTVHIYFKDKELLNKFNRLVSELRGSPLPDSYEKNTKKKKK